MRSVFLLPITRTLLVLAGLTGLLAIGATMWPMPTADQEQLARVNTGLEEAAPTVSVSDVTQILERPLFHESRRKPQKVAVAAPAAAPRRIEMPYSLVGILGNSSAERTVYLLNTKTQETISAKMDQQVGIWRVQEIQSNSVTLEANGTERTLSLENGGR